MNAPSVFVARQPIFDRQRCVYAYELLFRASPVSRGADVVDGNRATSEVIAGTLFAVGMRDILGGKRGFFNFTREHLFTDYSSILDPEQTIVEVLETVEPDEQVVRRCRELKARGYQLALDDFIAKDASNPLANLAQFIKVDFRGTSEAEQRSLAARFGKRGIRMLAEKVETSTEFERARTFGYSLFQGYFFATPEIVCGRLVPESRQHNYNLLRAVQRTDFDFNEIESILKTDMALIYKFLLFVNSARFRWLHRVTSIRGALVLLGQKEMRAWVSLAIVASLGEGRPAELVKTGVVRARFCEQLGAKAGFGNRTDGLFMMGMFSVMDAIMDRPLFEVLEGIHLEQDSVDVLLGTAREDSRTAIVYGVVRAYETGDWERVFSLAQRLGLPPDSIPVIYVDALVWAETVFGGQVQRVGFT